MRTESNYIRTYTGGKFWPLDPRPEDVNIIDIAHALANQCRFTGHLKEFYSVAQHCLVVSHYTPLEWALEGLLHDASEAYLIDLPRPVKYSPEIAFFKTAEKRIQQIVQECFNLKDLESPEVKQIDNRAGFTESQQLLEGSVGSSFGTREALSMTLIPFPPKQAERYYLDRFYTLQQSRNR